MKGAMNGSTTSNMAKYGSHRPNPEFVDPR
jgi:hypothetical protein